MQLFPSDIAILTDLSEARGLTVSEMVVREQSHVGFALDRRQRAGQLAYIGGVRGFSAISPARNSPRCSASRSGRTSDPQL